MQELFANGRIIDLILLLMVVEAAVLDVLAAHHAGFHIVLITDGVFDAHVRHDFKPPYFLFTASAASASLRPLRNCS